ncbi:MAG: pre-RNA processing PIH1/Nop17-domain-containing protein [Olpidium bornovanus]|uniref:Pre-RNA processing PIH1/Nop17-domain-containing protein n=1 Tax=Olpidium bornovanus TaxID=278681 RepID=A0A8H7ZWP2_9FUNG|nr:MAG: pre-RNA processing PIH1/Nop17-domain-containing protein [Olpidium bornovanus]
MIAAEERGERKAFDLTDAEVRRFQDAFKSSEFKRLFADYAAEISDPENRELYEKELLQLEAEKGAQDPQILRTEPGLCVKTFFTDPAPIPKDADKKEKVFINLCASDQIDKATSQVGTDPTGTGKTGQQWQIPYALAGNGREDKDKNGEPAVVFDCAFHPDAVGRSLLDGRFRDMLVQTAMEAVQKRSGRVVSKQYVMPKNLRYKGTPRSTTVLKQDPASNCAPTSGPSVPRDFEKEEFLAGLELRGRDPGPPPSGKATTSQDPRAPLIQELGDAEAKRNPPPGPVEPSYRIVNRGRFDMGRYTDARVKQEVPGRPDELVVRVDLPLVLGRSDRSGHYRIEVLPVCARDLHPGSRTAVGRGSRERHRKVRQRQPAPGGHAAGQTSAPSSGSTPQGQAQVRSLQPKPALTETCPPPRLTDENPAAKGGRLGGSNKVGPAWAPASIF